MCHIHEPVQKCSWLKQAGRTGLIKQVYFFSIVLSFALFFSFIINTVCQCKNHFNSQFWNPDLLLWAVCGHHYVCHHWCPSCCVEVILWRLVSSVTWALLLTPLLAAAFVLFSRFRLRHLVRPVSGQPHLLRSLALIHCCCKMWHEHGSLSLPL